MSNNPIDLRRLSNIPSNRFTEEKNYSNKNNLMELTNQLPNVIH